MALSRRILDLLLREAQFLLGERGNTDIVGSHSDLNVVSKVVLTAHDTGISFDFPLAEDPRYRARRRAWRTFEVGIFILIGTLIAFVACETSHAWRILEVFLSVPLAVGFAYLVAASISCATWLDNCEFDELQKLSVVGKLLIRMSCDHRKQIWCRDEIRTIALEEKIEHYHYGTNTRAKLVLYCLHLIVELRNGDKAILMRHASPHPTDDNRPRAELEWIATELRHALFAETIEAPAHAIQDMDARTTETRISPNPGASEDHA